MGGVMQGVQPAAPGKSRGWSVVASASSVLSALLASTCCAGPLVLALLGTGGAGMLAALRPYQAHFVTLTFALLGTGFYVAYRKPRAVDDRRGGSECACPAPRASRAMKVVLWLAAGLVITLLAFPYLGPVLFGRA